MKNNLPAPPKNTRCSAMDSKGRRCPYLATTQSNYHGEHELYGYLSDNSKDRTWVRVAFCEKHADG